MDACSCIPKLFGRLGSEVQSRLSDGVSLGPSESLQSDQGSLAPFIECQVHSMRDSFRV